ncbi:M16 family metallopeptidase [Zhengella sp. ZM62]|uniref:M16 family metallopeptidase n=1 Tax=Zhengella sedimenti TaxID=3390035 RepID=UPI003975FC8F
MAVIRKTMLAALAGAALLTAAPATAADGRSEISRFMLDNGLEVVVIPDHRAPVVTHMLWYKTGSADEAPGKSGIAHFFEHLMFKGTSNNPPGAFSRAVSEIGGQENAFTSDDYTAYFQKVAPEALGTMMAFEADRMHNLILTDEVIGPERNVILEERAMRVDNNPSSLLSEEIDATLYQNHPYRIPVIGWKQEIEKLNRADAIEFYTRYYAPNNAVLVVAGDVTPEEVRALAEETYGQVPRGPDLPPRLRPQEPEQNTARVVTMRDPRVTVPSYQVNWVVPSYNTDEGLEAEALDLLAEILGGGTRSRLYQELVVKRGMAASVGAWYQGTALDDSRFVAYGTPRGETDVEELQQAILAEIARIESGGVTEEELEKARNRFIRQMIFSRDDQSGMARMYGSVLTTGGTVEDIQTWTDRIRQVTPDQVRDAARRWLDESRSVTGLLLPERETRS